VTTAPESGVVSVTVGAAAAPTVTLTAEDVTEAVFESVTRAVTETVPAAVGVQLTEYGAVFAVPTRVVPTKKSTLATVAGATEAAEAESATATPAVGVAPAEGAVSTTDGAVTLTLTIKEVTAVPFESVTRAVRAFMPAVVGVHVMEYGAESAEPMAVVPAVKKSTRPTVAPPLATAFAVTVVLAPRATLAPFVGAEMETVGVADVTVTLTADEVTMALFESVTRAVSENVPAMLGVQLKL
jgi:hypothetical protein